MEFVFIKPYQEMAKLQAVAELVRHLRGICSICRGMESTFSVIKPSLPPPPPGLAPILGGQQQQQQEHEEKNDVDDRMMGAHKFYLSVCRACLYRFKNNPHIK